MTNHNYKGARNRRIVKLHEEKGLSFRQIAEKEGVSVSIVHRIYWQEKMRSGERRKVPKRVKEQFSYLLKA